MNENKGSEKPVSKGNHRTFKKTLKKNLLDKNSEKKRKSTIGKKSKLVMLTLHWTNIKEE